MCLPSRLLNLIGELGKCKKLIPEKTHIFDYPPKIMDPLCRSKTVIIISSFLPCYLNLYLDLSKRGIKVSLVLEKTIYRKLISDCRNELKGYINIENQLLFVCEDKIELASYIISNQNITFSMISKDGRYYNHEILSIGRWYN
jgi:predicted transcriptional regulator